MPCTKQIIAVSDNSDYLEVADYAVVELSADLIARKGNCLKLSAVWTSTKFPSSIITVISWSLITMPTRKTERSP